MNSSQHQRSLASRSPLRLLQARLNLDQRSRTSRLPWRGQFSPNLVEYLMQEVCPESREFLDPFCGSGTVLFEALERGAHAVGAEVNPAAWHLASIARFSMLPKHEQESVLVASRRRVDDVRRSRDASRLFEALERSAAATDAPMVRVVLAATLLLAMGNGHVVTWEAASRAFSTIEATLSEMAETRAHGAHCLLNDARRLMLRDGSIDGVITSPPYINVFNYHQNHRPAVERLGWKPLEAARSEIGANRKHRQNRFLTVVQYALDMAAVINELLRVMKPCAPLVIVVGRTSSVLGASFANGEILEGIIAASGFHATGSVERVFVNRYGERIYEDILIADRRSGQLMRDSDAREIGVRALKHARAMVADKSRDLLEDAIDGALAVQQSPLLSLSAPPPFAELVAQ